MGRKPKGTNRILATIEQYRPDLTPMQWAYLAGIIDGEGSISVLRVMKRERNVPHYILQPIISIYTNSEALREWLGVTLGLTVHSRDRRAVSGQQTFKRVPSTCYQLQWWGYKCYNVLLGVQPHLVIKAEQARLLRAYIEARVTQAASNYNAPYTPENINTWLAIRALNRNASAPYPVEVDLSLLSTTSPRQPETLLQATS